MKSIIRRDRLVGEEADRIAVKLFSMTARGFLITVAAPFENVQTVAFRGALGAWLPVTLVFKNAAELETRDGNERDATSSYKRHPGRDRGVPALYIAIEEGCQLRFGEGAHLGGFHVAVLEQHQCRNAADAVAWRGFGIVINVEFGDFETTGVFSGDLIENGRNHLAGATPLCPVVNEDRAVGAQDLLFKSAVGNVNDLAAHSDSPVGPAQGWLTSGVTG